MTPTRTARSIRSALRPASLRGAVLRTAVALVAAGLVPAAVLAADAHSHAEAAQGNAAKSDAAVPAKAVTLKTDASAKSEGAAKSDGATHKPAAAPVPVTPTVRSAKSGPWSSPATWEGGSVPAAGARVQVQAGHRVVYDVVSDQLLKSVHVAGTLAFDPDKDTRLDVGLLLVKPGDAISETDAATTGAHPPHVPAAAAAPAGDAHAHRHGDAGHGDDAPAKAGDGAKADDLAAAGPAAGGIAGGAGTGPTLEVGTADHPVKAGVRALIRLTAYEGIDLNAGPALVASGGRVELYGAPMPRTWLKLRTTAKAGDGVVTLDAPAEGWRVGDQIVVVTTEKLSVFDKGKVIPTVRDRTQTEERTISAVDGQRITLDKPLGFDHTAEGEWRGEVANLSRNVIVESADPAGDAGKRRGHTMFHNGSAATVGYAEFRHLGKKTTLGRYPLHFHVGGDHFRGSSVVGASIWDSDNRWVTVHGTDYLVVRDCVGYRSLGHGFFLEDGTEVNNVFDRNLAVQALNADPLPEQALPFDKNDGSGFWWANSLNTFTRNVAAECDQYGYRFEAGATKEFESKLRVRQPDGSRKAVDIRTLPFVRFEDNEAHSQRRFGLNLGGVRMVARDDAYLVNADGSRGKVNPATTNIGHVDGVGPDGRHPFQVLNFKCWTTHWAYHSAAPNVSVNGLDVYDSNYGIWRSRVDGAEFRNLSLKKIASRDIFVPWGGGKDYDNEYAPSVSPKDDRPPTTVITGVERARYGQIVVRGTTADNGKVTRVTVNGVEAREVEPNFAQWEARVDVPAGGAGGEGATAPATLTAVSADAAGNVEKTPHVLALPAAAAGKTARAE